MLRRAKKTLVLLSIAVASTLLGCSEKQIKWANPGKHFVDVRTEILFDNFTIYAPP